MKAGEREGAGQGVFKSQSFGSFSTFVEPCRPTGVGAAQGGGGTAGVKTLALFGLSEDSGMLVEDEVLCRQGS